jgi:hypothetical protein
VALPVDNIPSGALLPVEQWNRLGQWNNQIGLWSWNGALYGEPPATGAPGFLIQTGAIGGGPTGTTNASGYLTLGFPMSFPNGVISVVATPSSVSGCTSVGLSAPPIVPSPNQVNLRFLSGSAPLANTEIEFSWIAIGF